MTTNRTNLPGCLLAVAMLSAVSTSFAATLRVDVSGEKEAISDQGIPMTFDTTNSSLQGEHYEWLPENMRDKRLGFTGKAGANWLEYSLTFTPKASGNVVLILMSKSSDAPVYYDKVEVSGAEIENGDFETLDQKTGLPAKWFAMGHPIVDSQDTSAPAGTITIKADEKNRLCYTLFVQENQPVTVTFFSKAE